MLVDNPDAIGTIFVSLGYILAVIAGYFFPDIDTIDEEYHRSWLTHTYLLPAIIFKILSLTALGTRYPVLSSTIQYLALGMTVHFIKDYLYPKRFNQQGTVWPIQPTLLSFPWGFLWLSIAWAIQWFIFIVPSFIPWLIRGDWLLI